MNAIRKVYISCYNKFDGCSYEHGERFSKQRPKYDQRSKNFLMIDVINRMVEISKKRYENSGEFVDRRIGGMSRTEIMLLILGAKRLEAS